MRPSGRCKGLNSSMEQTVFVPHLGGYKLVFVKERKTAKPGKELQTSQCNSCRDLLRCQAHRLMEQRLFLKGSCCNCGL